MIDLLVADLDKEIQELTVEEKDAQADYEKFIQDSADKRALDSKAITDKEAAKASLEEELEANKVALKDKQVALMETEKVIMELHKECDWLLEKFDLRKEARAGEVEALKKAIMELHKECDWLLEKFDLRKEARAGEVEALKKAKAVLSGADYSM